MKAGSGPAGGPSNGPWDGSPWEGSWKGPGNGLGRKPDRERVYNGADRQPAQNLDTAYRSRWAVNAAGGRRREDSGSQAVQVPPHRLPPLELSPTDSLATGASRRSIDLGPLMRLAHESCWARLFNHPRRSAIADA